MSEIAPFLSPRLIGSRFENHTIPLEVLKDLAALESILVDVAKWHYFQENPDKQRCPNGFTNGVSLRLAGIEEGSAIPQIVLISALTLLPVSEKYYFHKAKESIIAAVNAAQQNQDFTQYMPEHLLSGFDRIGRSLHEDEAIEFNPENPAQPARLDQTTRHKLVLASSKVQEYTQEVILRGSMIQVNVEQNSFQIKLIDGRQVNGWMLPYHCDTAIDALKNARDGVKVKAEGVGVYNRYGQLKSIASVEHLSLLPSRDIGARLDEFRQFKPGWFDGDGVKFNQDQLNWLSDRFDSLYAAHLPLPLLYPLHDGRVRAEWHQADFEAALEVNMSQRTGHWLSFIKSESHELERELNLTDEQDWQWINQQLGDRVASV